LNENGVSDTPKLSKIRSHIFFH